MNANDGFDFCGSSTSSNWFDSFEEVSITKTLTETSILKLTATSNLDEDPEEESFGITDVVIETDCPGI